MSIQKHNTTKLAMLAGTLVLACAPSYATIISGDVTAGSAFADGGTFVKLTLPFVAPVTLSEAVGDDTFQTPNLYGFDEFQNIHLLANLAVDLKVGGGFTLPTGTTVASHYIFFDPGPLQTITGHVNFDSDVLAILDSTGRLLGSDFLVASGVSYLNPSLRGLEPGDSVTISGPRQITFSTEAGTPGDYVRVLTVFSPGVPEPTTIWLFVGGVAAIAVGFRRKRIN